MKKLIKNFVIVGDSLSKEPSFKDIPLLGGNLSFLPKLIANKSLLWYEYLLDMIFYTANDLPSGFSSSQYSKYRKEVNLQHYVFNYIYDKVRVVEDPVSQRGLSKISYANLNNIFIDIERLSRQNIACNSLIILFVGMNDIISSSSNIDVLVEKYKEKINSLIVSGYTNFVIIDIPNFFQSDLTAKIEFFNTLLSTQVDTIKQSNPAIEIEILSSTIALNNVSKKLEEDTENGNFNLSRDAHFALADSFYKSIFASKYEFMLPKLVLLELFRTKYFDAIAQNRSGYFSWFHTKPWDRYESASLREIFSHSDANKNNRTFQVLKALNWVNQSGDCISINPIIIKNATYVNSKLVSIC